MTRTALTYGLTVLLALTAASAAFAGSYIFSGDSNGVDGITHPTGYDGTGGALGVSVCIDPTSSNATQMAPAVQRAIATWNAQLETTGNIRGGGTNDVPPGNIDFESIVVHELGHCLGLAHVNLATESGLPFSLQDFTKSTMGIDATFDTGAGVDAIQGSSDDLRDDDINLHWFEIGINNPFQGPATVFDSTTFSRSLGDLPVGQSYATNGDRTVSGALGFGNTESVMQQRTFFDEAQRSLTRDDVATLRYAMSGLDELANTADDYSLSLSYAGLTNSCDVVVDFDDTQTSFAVCLTGGAFIPDPPPGPPSSTDHVAINSAQIFFNTGFTWYFDATCGDGVTGGTESCDDGGTSGGDGCDAICQIEPGYLCSGEPSICGTTCGDGLIAGSETCDDSGTSPGDGCDAICQIEPGYLCSGEPSACGTTCGDGVTAGAEACDDGGTTGGDGCDAVCQFESGYSCTGNPSTCETLCGDGLIAGTETCDDGGSSPGDGCDATCEVESGYQCNGEPSTCSVTTSVPVLTQTGRAALGLLLLVLGAAGMRQRSRR